MSGLERTANAPVAQLDRVFGYEPKGRGFESLLAYQQHEHILFRFGSIVFVFLYFPRRSTRPKPRLARTAVWLQRLFFKTTTSRLRVIARPRGGRGNLKVSAMASRNEAREHRAICDTYNARRRAHHVTLFRPLVLPPRVSF